MEIQVEHISKAFGRTAALNDVSLSVGSGELVALLGPSGSGKTTLLRCIAGLENPSDGRILFGSEDATDIPVQRRGVGFVFQHYALFRHMSVADNIAYGLRVRGRARRPPEKEIRRRVGDLLDLVQLAGVESRYPTQLSGGQRQRVALARALAVEPRVLLLDEPFGALDAQVRKDLRRWLREIHERTGRTTLFVTHDQEEALELADRIAILRDGRVEQVGTPDEVYEDPASPFVMAFVGDTSRFRVKVQDGVVWREDTRLAVSANGTGDGLADLYVRPWDLGIKAAGTPGTLTGTVVAVIRTSSGRRAEVRLTGSDDLLETEIPAAVTLRPNEPVAIAVLQGRLYPAK